MLAICHFALSWHWWLISLCGAILQALYFCFKTVDLCPGLPSLNGFDKLWPQPGFLAIFPATAAVRNGVPDHLIQAMGCWSSNAYQLYIRTPLELLATLSQKLVWHYLYINKQIKTSKKKTLRARPWLLTYLCSSFQWQHRLYLVHTRLSFTYRSLGWFLGILAWSWRRKYAKASAAWCERWLCLSWCSLGLLSHESTTPHHKHGAFLDCLLSGKSPPRMYGGTGLPLFAGPSVLQALGDGCVLGGSRFQGCLATSFPIFFTVGLPANLLSTSSEAHQLAMSLNVAKFYLG